MAIRRLSARMLREPMMRVDSLRERLQFGLTRRFQELIQRLQAAKSMHRSHHPLMILQRREELLGQLSRRMTSAVNATLQQKEQQINHLEAILRTLGPDSSLQRGYSITYDADGKVLRSRASVKDGDVVVTRLADGEFSSRVSSS